MIYLMDKEHGHILMEANTLESGKKGLWHGQATFTYPDGKVVKGIFIAGELIEQQ